MSSLLAYRVKIDRWDVLLWVAVFYSEHKIRKLRFSERLSLRLFRIWACIHMQSK